MRLLTSSSAIYYLLFIPGRTRQPETGRYIPLFRTYYKHLTYVYRRLELLRSVPQFSMRSILVLRVTQTGRQSPSIVRQLARDLQSPGYFPPRAHTASTPATRFQDSLGGLNGRTCLATIPAAESVTLRCHCTLLSIQETPPVAIARCACRSKKARVNTGNGRMGPSEKKVDSPAAPRRLPGALAGQRDSRRVHTPRIGLLPYSKESAQLHLEEAGKMGGTGATFGTYQDAQPDADKA